MRRLLLLACLLAVASAAAAPKKGENARVHRAQWVHDKSESFHGKVAMDVARTMKRFHIDECPSASNYRMAFSLANDGRLVFATVTLKGGKFVRGKLERFGLPDVNLTAAEYAEIRRTKPIAITLASYEKAPVCLVPPTTRPSTFKAPHHRGLWGVLNPPEYFFGSLPGHVGQLGAHYSPATYEAWVTPPGKPAFRVDTLPPGRQTNADELCNGMRAGLNQKGSDREMLDIYYSSTVEYRIVDK